MKIKYFLIILASLLFTRSNGQNLNEFTQTITNCGMTFTLPLKFLDSKVIKNDDMEYDYALKYKDKEFEVRYAIRPILLIKYSSVDEQKEMESQKSFRNSQYKIILSTIILNITGGVDYKIQEFDSDAVKTEFNADWGATTFVELNSDFGKGFRYCMIVAIHKKDKADAYYFYMANSKENFSENMDPLFHTLKFN